MLNLAYVRAFERACDGYATHQSLIGRSNFVQPAGFDNAARGKAATGANARAAARTADRRRGVQRPTGRRRATKSRQSMGY